MHDEILLERLATLEHEQWTELALYLLRTEHNLSPELRARWERMVRTPYPELVEAVKEANRKFARRALEVTLDRLKETGELVGWR